jgi:acetate---CoA ligase (ADP-forming) subunit beta
MTNLDPKIIEIIETSCKYGWVLESDAKQIFSLLGFTVPRFTVAKTLDNALQFANKIGYPVVAKIVSPLILHKSDVGGVLVGVANDKGLTEAFQRFSSMNGFVGVLVDEMVSGIELIVGAKIDFQFGPMVLVGIGGTSVEIYRDVILKMAPLSRQDGLTMIRALKGYKLLNGYRGAEPVDIEKLADILVNFSTLIMALKDEIESIDINPLLCSAGQCVIADARIILKKIKER